MGKVSAAPFPSPDSRKPKPTKQPKPGKVVAEVVETVEPETTETAAE